MRDTDRREPIETFPHIPVAVDSPELIVECLEDGQAAVIHRHSSMDSQFDIEVVASRAILHETPHLAMLGQFAFKGTVEAPQFHQLSHRYIQTLRAMPLSNLGLHATFVPGEKKSARLSYEQDKKNAVTTWFSPPGTQPYLFSISNNRRDGQERQIGSTPPVYRRATVRKEIIAFMKLLAIPDQVLGGSGSEYAIDFVEARSNQQRVPRSKRSKRTKSPQPKQPPARSEKSAVEDNAYAPRLSTPNAQLEDIHGLSDDVHMTIEERVLTFSNLELAKQYDVQTSGGWLLYGPAGTGKTMLATAIANKISAKMWQVDAADLIEKWVGESAANVKKLFGKAVESAKEGPIVLLFDELDSVVGAKDEHGAERAAALGEFKRSLSYISEQAPNILVIATTNNPDKLDEALIRAGRFDVQIYMGMPDEEARLKILTDHIHLGRITYGAEEETGETGQEAFDADDKDPFAVTDPDRLFDGAYIDFSELAKLTDGLSGADIAAIIKSCRFEKFRQHATDQLFPGPITHADIIDKIINFRTTRV